jgi:hypothetical protein
MPFQRRASHRHPSRFPDTADTRRARALRRDVRVDAPRAARQQPPAVAGHPQSPSGFAQFTTAPVVLKSAS